MQKKHQKIADLEMIALINTKSQQKKDHEDIKVKLEQVEKVLHAMTRKVLSLEEEVKDLKNKSITNDNILDLKKKAAELCEKRKQRNKKYKSIKVLILIMMILKRVAPPQNTTRIK